MGAPPPTTLHNDSWAHLPPPLFDLCAQWMTARERLTLVERVCADWRRQSAGGLGWTHTLDVLWAYWHVCVDWHTLSARLGRRLRPERLLHVQCPYQILRTSAASTVAALLSVAPLAVPLSTAAAAAAVSTGAAKTPLPDGEETGAFTEEAEGLFPRCATAVVSVAGSLNRDTSVDLQLYFPRVQRLHVCAGGSKHDSSSIEIALDLDPDTLPSATVVSEGVREKRLQWAAALNDTDGETMSAAPIYIRPLAALEHLCLSGDGSGDVVLDGEWPALRSLRTMGPIAFSVCKAPLKLPCLTHLAFSNAPYGSLQILVAAAAETLLALFTVQLSVYEGNELLSPCKRLRTLHIADPRGGPHDFSVHLKQMAAVSSLRDVGYYCRHLGVTHRGSQWCVVHRSRRSTFSTSLSLRKRPLLGTLAHLSLVDSDSAAMALARPSQSTPLPRGSWLSLAFKEAPALSFLFCGPSESREREALVNT